MQCATMTSTAATALRGGPEVVLVDLETSRNELEMLRQIYDEICDIRQRHADIVADTAAKKQQVSRENHNTASLSLYL